MENLERNTFKNFLSGATFGLLVVFILAFTVGCGKKDGGSSITRGNGGVGTGQQCIGCTSGGSTFLGAGIGASYNGSVEVALDFHLDGVNNSNFNGVMAQGHITFVNDFRCITGTSIPRGVYDLQTSTAGSRDSVSHLITGVQLQAHNGNYATNISVSNASLLNASPKYLSCENNGHYDELSAQVYIQQIDGYVCNTLVYVEMKNHNVQNCN